jgi:hypothetical protein
MSSPTPEEKLTQSAREWKESDMLELFDLPGFA